MYDIKILNNARSRIDNVATCSAYKAWVQKSHDNGKGQKIHVLVRIGKMGWVGARLIEHATVQLIIATLLRDAR